MGFISTGPKSVIIIGALIAEAKFNKENDPDKFDVCLQLREEETGFEDVWRGEVSSKLITGGKFQGKPQYESTLDALQKVGWTHGFDFAKLPEHFYAEAYSIKVISEWLRWLKENSI